MTKAELIRKLTRLTGVPDSEAKIFFENFLVRTSDMLRLGEAIKLNGFGYFQLKRGMFKNVVSSISKSNVAYADLILFTPLNQNEELSENMVFNVPSLREEDFHHVDLYFSLSIGKPIIPMQNTSADDFFIPPSGLELKKLLNFKIDKLLSEVEIINKYVKGSELLIIDAGKNSLDQYEFNWNNVISENLFSPNNSNNPILISAEANDSGVESLNWDFGENLTKQIEEEILLDTTKDLPSLLDYDFDNPESIEWNFGSSSKSEETQTINKIIEENANFTSEFDNDNFKKDDPPNVFKSIDFRKEIVHKINNFEKVSSLTHEFVEDKKSFGITKSEQNLSWDFKKTYSNLKNNNVKIDNEIFVEKTDLSTNDDDKNKFISDENVTSIISKEDIPSNENLNSYIPAKKKELRKDIKKTNSSLRTKSSFFLFVGLIVIIFIGVFFYAAVTKFNLIQNLNGRGKISKKSITPKTTVIERSYKIPVDYPYIKKELNSFSGNPIQSIPKNKSIVPSKIENNNNLSKVSFTNNVNDLKINDKYLKKIKNNIYGREGNYIIQVSSWKSKSFALNEARKFKKKGLNSYVEKANVNGKGAWYRVKISGFKTLADAEKYLSINQ